MVDIVNTTFMERGGARKPEFRDRDSFFNMSLSFLMDIDPAAGR